MRIYWSDELRIMLRPVSTYRQLSKAAGDSGIWVMIRRPLFVALVVGAFVSITDNIYISGKYAVRLFGKNSLALQGAYLGVGYNFNLAAE